MQRQQDARDAQNRLEIVGSCRVIKSHASFIGAAAQEIAYMPQSTVPMCMDELNEAEGVMRRALDRIERAKETLLLKADHQLTAAE